MSPVSESGTQHGLEQALSKILGTPEEQPLENLNKDEPGIGYA